VKKSKRRNSRWRREFNLRWSGENTIWMRYWCH